MLRYLTLGLTTYQIGNMITPHGAGWHLLTGSVKG